MASAVHYVHPDKPPELWINEVGVAATHRRTGLARRLLQTLFARGSGGRHHVRIDGTSLTVNAPPDHPRWTLAAAIGVPFLVMTVYLVWVWPRPAGNSVMAQAAPYVLSLLTGVPFVWRLTRRSGRGLFLLAFLGGGFVLLCIYALAILCGLRGVCL